MLNCLFLLKVFADWNKGELDSFLIEITKDILAYKDSDGTPLVEKIRDSAGQVKGMYFWKSFYLQRIEMTFGKPKNTIIHVLNKNVQLVMLFIMFNAFYLIICCFN